MKRSLCTSLAAVTIASSLFSASVYAAESQSQPTTQPVQTAVPQVPQVPQEPVVPLAVTTDNTARIVTDGIHVDVSYPNEAYIPEFTMELWSVTDDKLISSAVGNSKDYDKVKGAYHLIFNDPGYHLGDQFALILRSADGIIDHIRFKDEKPNEKGEVNYSDLKVNTYYQFKIDSFTYFEGDEGKEQVIKDLTATALHPIKATMQTDNKKIGLFLKSENGAPLKKTPLDIKLLDNKGELHLTSDDNGIAWVDTNKLTWKFLVSSKGKTVKDSGAKAEIELPQAVVAGQQKEAVTIPVVFQNEEAATSIKVNLSPVGNTDLSTSWTDVDLILTSSDGVSSTYSLNHENNTIAIPEGTYKVAVESKYADATLKSDTLTVKGGSASLDISLMPKYTLSISKDGKPFNFSVINVADKKYTGKDPLVFGVSPGESFLIRNNDSGKVESVVIEPKSPKTNYVLGAGIVFGGSVTIPHTGDNFVWLVAGFILSIFGAAASFIFYRRRKKNAS